MTTLTNKNKQQVNYLSFISTKALKKYITTYYGQLVQDVFKDENSIELIVDKKVGPVFKVSYLYSNDYDLILSTETIFIGQFGHLYETDKGLTYSTIERIETKNFYKFMKDCIHNEEVSQNFDNDFIIAHKKVLLETKEYRKKIEKENFKSLIARIDTKYNELSEDLDAISLEAYLKSTE